jgi:acyl-CoA thioesterase I
MITYKKPWLHSGEKLVCFGDSITASKEGYVMMLQKELEKSNINVINAGRGGDKTPWALTRFQQDVLDVKPDAVSIYLGTNDAAVGRGVWADEPQVPLEAYQANLVWMIHLCRLNEIKKISIATPAWRFEGKAFVEFGNLLETYCLAARRAADQMQCPLVSLDTAFAEEWATHPAHTGLLLTTDGIHMTKKANRLIADTMLKTWGI